MSAQKPQESTPRPLYGAEGAETDIPVSSDDGTVRAPSARQSITVTLPLPPRELWPNRAGKLRDRLRAKREAREWAYYATLAAITGQDGLEREGLGLPWRRVKATAAYTFQVRRVRDDDNLTSALKVSRDAIASVICGDAGDAGWTWAGTPTVSIGPGEGVVITVRAVREGE